MKSGHKIIGYFAFTKSGLAYCDGDALIIAGSQDKMNKYISMEENSEGSEKFIIKKTKFSEITDGLKQGALYVFDKESFERMSPLIEHNQLNCNTNSGYMDKLDCEFVAVNSI